MATEDTKTKRTAGEDGSMGWKATALNVTLSGAKILAAGVMSGLGFSIGQSLHRRATTKAPTSVDNVVPLAARKVV